MQEYHRKDWSPLAITYSASSYASGLSFSAYDLDTGEFVQSGAGAPGASSVFTITLTQDSVAFDRKLKLDFFTSTASGVYSETRLISAVRPYADIDRLRLDNPNETDRVLYASERKARAVIDSFLGYGFYKVRGAIELYGSGSDVLFTGQPVLSINSIYEDGVAVFSSSASLNSFNSDIEISLSKNRIRMSGVDQYGEIYEFPDVSVLPGRGIFRKNALYRVEGIFGFEYVPTRIEDAAALLVEDYLCNDSAIRNKNVQEFSNDMYKMKYADGFSTGTGNLVVDDILSEFTDITPMVI